MSKAKQLEFDGMGRPNPFIKKGTDPRAQEIEFMFVDIEDWLANKAPEDFDQSFIVSLQAQFLRRGTLSDKQYTALKNIWYRWVENPNDWRNDRDEY